MKVTSIKIENYKSFATENNRIALDDINTVIGKNESGKSNLIEAIGKINFNGISDQNLFKNTNKNNNGSPIFSIALRPYEDEKKIYNSEEETIFVFKDRYDIEFTGGLSEIIRNNRRFQMHRNRINVLRKELIINDSNIRVEIDKLIQMINEAENKIFIENQFVERTLSLLKKDSAYERIAIYFKFIIQYFRELYSIFPKFIVLDDMSLKSKYTRDYLNDNIKSKEMLKYFLQTINMNIDELKKYWILTGDDDKYNFEEEINDKIKVLMEGFNEFYKQENVELKVHFNNDSLNFIVKTNKKYLNLDERSNGLKWYLNMYIQLVSKTRKNNIENFVVLLDEPGVFLHVNAQKKLLELFEHFVLKSNQIIYTTQHPSMIYQEHLYRIRTVIKDEDGNSNIGNKYYSLPHKMEGKLETITPILNAIGMNIGCDFTTINSDKINIITEGISDYNYLKAFFIQSETPDIYNIIPSTSVTNIHNIVSILIGWGCRYKIIVDQDNEGRKQFDLLNKKLAINPENIIFVDGTNVSNKDMNFTIEDLFSDMDKQKIGINLDGYSSEKAYYSTELLKKIESGEFRYSRVTMKNIGMTINRLFNVKE